MRRSTPRMGDGFQGDLCRVHRDALVKVRIKVHGHSLRFNLAHTTVCGAQQLAGNAVAPDRCYDPSRRSRQKRHPAAWSRQQQMLGFAH
jgi:hypothetical protein